MHLLERFMLAPKSLLDRFHCINKDLFEDSHRNELSESEIPLGSDLMELPIRKLFC